MRSGSISTATGSHTRRPSTTESSSSSSGSRYRNALVTTFAPPSLTGSPTFAADVFSLTAILLDLTSLILGRSVKEFSTHRSKHNRSAGRGGAPADASFHKNLVQVGTWIELLQSQAKEKERVFRKAKFKGKAQSLFYGSVVGVLSACKTGLCKEPSHRLTASELEKEVRQWVDGGLGTGRHWCCGAEAEEVIPGVSFASVAGADSRINRREGSLRTESCASLDIILPIERPTPLMDSNPLDYTSVIGRIEEDIGVTSSLKGEEMFMPDEEKNDWPLRRESKMLTERYDIASHSRFDGKNTRKQTRPLGGFYEFE